MNKVRELAQILASSFEEARLEAERLEAELGNIRFKVGVAEPNMISIMLPDLEEGMQVDQIYGLIDSFIHEAEYKVTTNIEIHLYDSHGAHIEGRTLYPKNVN